MHVLWSSRFQELSFCMLCELSETPKLLNSNMFLLGVIFLLCIVFFWALLMSYNITYLHNKFSSAMFSYIPVHHKLWVCNSFLLLFFSLFYCAHDENKYKQPYIRIILVKCLFKGSRQGNHEACICRYKGMNYLTFCFLNKNIYVYLVIHIKCY